VTQNITQPPRCLLHQKKKQTEQSVSTAMPRSVTPFSNPYAHGSHTLTPYARRQQESASPLANSDKENEAPGQQPGKVLASQAAFRDKLSEQSDTQYYDPFQPREKVRDVMKSYRQLIQDTTGMFPA